MASAAARLCLAPRSLSRSGADALPSPCIREIPKTSGPLEQEDRERLLLLHLPQVRLVAEGLRERLRFAMELEDLMSYGVIGLLKAIERFDPTRGILLKTYAEHRIRGAILDGVRAMDWLPRSVRQKERRYQESVSRLEEARPVFPRTPAARLSAPRGRSLPLSRPVPPPLPRMELIYAGADLADVERVSERAGLRGLLGGVEEDPETVYQRKEMREKLTRAVSRLPRRHRAVMKLYYQQELSMKQIGQILRVHESRISQLHAAAIKRLRIALAPVHENGSRRAAPTARLRIKA